MNILEGTIETNLKKIPILYNEVVSDKILIYFHGLGGTAGESKPIFKNIVDFTVIAVKQRGHENNDLLASRFYKKYIEDIFDVIIFYKKRNKKIYLLGESMGSIYCSLIAYYFKDAVEAVFPCSIPSKLTNIFIENKRKKFIINFRTAITYFFNINYKYSAKLDYQKLTSNKILLRIIALQKEQIAQTRNIISTWIGIRKFWHMIKLKNPNCPIYYFQGDKDIMSKNELTLKKLEYAQKKFRNFNYEIIPEGKHVILYEKNNFIIFNKINEIMKKNN